MKGCHELKVWPEFFDLLRRGDKRFEVRHERDRYFEAWDHLVLREWDRRLPYEDGEWKNRGGYTGRVLCAVVTHVLRADPDLPVQLPEGLAFLSIRLLHDHMDDQKGTYFGKYLEEHLPQRVDAFPGRLR